ncbi:MAG: hypothetical protein ACXWLH_04255 [Candidatus Saccharimonadales bacterium]
MPALKPSRHLHEQVTRKEQAQELKSTGDKENAIEVEMTENRELSKKAVKLHRAIREAGLQGKWFTDPTIDPDYPDRSTQYRTEATFPWSTGGEEDEAELGLYVRVKANSGSKSKSGKQLLALLDVRYTTHALEDVKDSSSGGVSIDPPAYTSGYRTGSHIPGLILETDRRDIEATLAVIEVGAVAKGMEPVNLFTTQTSRTEDEERLNYQLAPGFQGTCAFD